MSILEQSSESDQQREFPGLACNSCNTRFADEAEQKAHYKSEWHRYNLKRKVAGVPGVTEALFLARQSALAEEQNKLKATPMLYSCSLCGKGYRSSKAHAQHLNSKSHLLRASQGTNDQEVATAIIKPLPSRTMVKSLQDGKEEAEESEESEWEEADSDEDMIDEATDSLTQLRMKDHMPLEGGDDVIYDVLVPTSCFMCDKDHNTIESCMVHMHKQHGFFIPDVEYLKDPEGLLTYLGLKVKRDYTCLYCDDQCQPFSSVEAVRKHMEAKSHCKVRYGDGGDDEEAELDEFYDYSSSYQDVGGGQIIEGDGVQKSVELGGGGSELIITRKDEEGISSRILGSREFLRYYRQKPRPTPANHNAVMAAALASRYRSMGLATVQSREHRVRLKVLRTMNKSGVEVMRSKLGMKSNVIRNLPNNVPY